MQLAGAEKEVAEMEATLMKVSDDFRNQIEEKDAEIGKLHDLCVKYNKQCVDLVTENLALRAEVERLKALETSKPSRMVHSQFCAVNSYSGRPNKCTCGLENEKEH